MFLRHGSLWFFLLICCALASRRHADAQSSRPGMGSIPYADAGGTGVTFRVWAPNASSVTVRGDFNGWGTTSLKKESSGGLWSLDVAGARAGQEYQYQLNGSMWRRDPRSRRVTNSNGNSIIYDPDAFDWEGQTFNTPYKNDTVIYEMHAGTFNAESWVPSSFDRVIERLDHIRRLGCSVVQVMPVCEFPADKSWGYNPTDLFAIESALGGPDAFKRFVKACHERGMAVYVDVVHNHYGPTDLSLWQFDGWSQNGYGGIYFYNSTDGKPNTWWGDTRPDFGRSELRDFVKDQIRMFLGECRVDGFRWDSVFNIVYYNQGANYNDDGKTLLEQINWEMQTDYPGKMRIAEDHAFDYNMNFDALWHVAFHDTLKDQITKGQDSWRDMNVVASLLNGWATHNRVIYSESHDTVGDLNNKHRLPRDIDGENPWSIWARKRQLLAAGIVMTAPGMPMIMQGQEMNEDWTFSAETALRWSLTNSHAGIVSSYRDLIHARRNLRGGTQGLKGTGVNVHHIDDASKVIACVRWDAGGGSDDVVVVANFSATTHNSGAYQIEFPSSGTWYCHYNSDDTRYGADFGGIGGSDVVASGSPARAAVNMGMYALQIFSKTAPVGEGQVSFDPAAPDGCETVTITYDPAEGPLAGAEQVKLYLGHNGWLNIVDTNMVRSGDLWTFSYPIPYNTHRLDMSFHDGGGVWDNNVGMNWRLDVANCGPRPSSASVTPATPAGCVPVTISYDVGEGGLTNANPVYLFIGRNGWNFTQMLAMTNVAPRIWETTYAIPEKTWQLDFVFTDGGALWDNNSGQDWHTYVSGCNSIGTRGVMITNPASDRTVAYACSQTNLAGAASTNLAAALAWTNTHARLGGSFPMAVNWSVADIPLIEGANLLRISGVSQTPNPNAYARDSATNALYSSNNTWTNGQNGGTGWGSAWQLSGGPNAGHYLAHDEPNLSVGAKAWGLWAHSDDTSEAVRQFAGPLGVGDAFGLKFENNNINSGYSVGLGLRNELNQNLFEFMFIGGGTNYVLNDQEGLRNTGIPWTDSGLTLAFEMAGETAYRFVVNGQVFTGWLADSSDSAIIKFRLWNYGNEGGSPFNLYVTDLTLDGNPDGQLFTDEITITRQYGTDSDPDGDGYITRDEETAGTDPFSAQSRPPSAEARLSGGFLQFDIPGTVLSRWYRLYMSTNLAAGAWQGVGDPVAGDGGAKTIPVAPTNPCAFYRIGISTN